MSTDKPTLALGPAATGPEAQEARVIARYGSAAAATGTDIQKIVNTAQRIRSANLMPSHVKTDEQAVIIALRGSELGLPLIQSWHVMYVIQGRAAMEAKTMIALAYRFLPTFDFTIQSHDQEHCSAKARRSKDHTWVPMTFDRADAEKAGVLGKENWRKHPKAMYLARVQAMLARAVAPDTFSGLYTADEIDSGSFVVEEGSAEDVMEADFEVKTPEERYAWIDALTKNEIVDRVKEEGLTGEMAAARKDLEITDKSEESLRRMYRKVQEDIDAALESE